MERKRIEKLVALLLIGILIPVSLFPFRIEADAITTSNINGISVVLDEVTFIENKTWTISGGTLTLPRNYFNYNAEIQFDKSYLGYVDITISYTYFARNDTGVTNFNGTKVQKVFVNGDKAYLAFGFIANSSTDPLTYNSISYTLNSSDLIEYGLISDIQTIIQILQDNQDIITDIYGELQSIVSNTSLANDYLDIISKNVQYHYPIESFSFIYEQIKNEYEIDSLIENYYYDYPIFIVPANSSIYRFYGRRNRTYDLIFGLNTNLTEDNLINYINIPTGYNIEFISSNIRGVNEYRFYHIQLVPNSDADSSYRDFSFTREYKFIPVFVIDFNRTYNVSTEFALQWGLTNSFLDNISIIAQGTIQSSSASASLDQTTSQFSDDANDLVTIEESFNDSMNQSLQSVNPTFNMGSSFLTSANWVSQQFNRIVNNTPFASLITFGLTLGLGLLIIGKVRK